jgi:hypothetical protein
MTKERLVRQIISKSHLSQTKDLARQYWDSLDIDPFKLQMDDFLELKRHIQYIIDKLSSKKDYQIIPRLHIKEKILINKNKISLRVSGNYFDDREGITFYKRNKSTGLNVGFCGQLNGCNQTPFIQGFITWINIYLLENDK